MSTEKPFFIEGMKYPEKNAINTSYESLVAREVNPQEWGSIVMPVHYQETSTLATALDVYSNSREMTLGQISVLCYVNGPVGKDIDTSPAMTIASHFAQMHPEFPISMATAQYKEPKMGIIRRDASILALRRIQKEHVPFSNYLLINHDADLIGLPEHYFSTGQALFQENANLALVSALAYYDRDTFKDYDSLLWLQRFLDVMNIYSRYKEHYIRGEENNMWVRAQDYVEGGGHRRVRVSEGSKLIRDRLDNGKDFIATTQKPLRAQYSARRHISTVASSILFADRYEHFVRPTDPIHGTVEQPTLPAEAYKQVSSELLGKELTEMFLHTLYHRVRKIDPSLELVSADKIYDTIYNNQPTVIQDAQVRFRKCAGLLGKKISFDRYQVQVNEA